MQVDNLLISPALYVYKALIAFIILTAVMLFSLVAQAQSTLTVEDITVDINSESAATARNEAILTAQRQALDSLAMQGMAENTEDIDTTVSIPDSLLMRLVRDFEIADERFSTTRYQATFTVRFHQNATAMALQSVAPQVMASTTSTQNDGTAPSPAFNTPTRLVIPILKIGERALLWQEPNPWREAWQSAPTSALIRVPVGDILDIRDVTVQAVMTAQNSSLQRLAQRYGATEVIAAIATSDAAPLNPNQMITVTFYRLTDQAAPQKLEETIAHLDKMTNLAPFTQASNQALLKMQSSDFAVAAQIQPEVIAIAAPQLPQIIQDPVDIKRVSAVARYNSLKDWVALQRRLQALPVISSVQPERLAGKSAKLRLAYSGDLLSLTAALRQAGIPVDNDNMLAPSAATVRAGEPRLTLLGG